MLLAKSADSAGYKETLLEHTQAVEDALNGLISIWPDLPPLLKKAARFHDFGKAADGFQKALTGGPPWGFRHEILSAAIFRSCFDLKDPEVFRVYLALLTHHKNFGGEFVNDHFFKATCSGGRSKYASWYKKWQQLRADDLRATFPLDLANWIFDPNEISPADDVEDHSADLKTVWVDLPTAQARGALVAADHLASAHMGVALKGHNITRKQLEISVKSQLKKRDVTWEKWSFMQTDCAQTAGNALLIAPTGSGKTEAALLWALENRKAGERIFYILPYQVSINAMAARLAQLFPDAAGNDNIVDNDNVSALHSNVDLAMYENSKREGSEEDEALQKALRNRDAARKVYAPIKVTTVYQLLQIFFGKKFFEIGLLELSGALIVFDEIHAYDGHTMGLILVMLNYLQKLGARVLIMTATLPTALKKQLAEAANITKEITLESGDELLKEARRRLHILPDYIEDEATLELIRTQLKARKKVAIVCSTVRKAMAMRELLSEYNPYLIHSRFTLGDRAEREDKDRIQEKMNEGRVIIATQVLEVSLDVSFDRMFCELAPADALLQRFGRVNRHGGGKTTVPVWVCCGEDKGSNLIYGEELLGLSRTWMETHVASGVPLDFEQSLAWMEYVYPQGLPPEELAKMEKAKKGFANVVANLKPMLDPPANVDLELNLFQSIQVVPSKFEIEYTEHRDAGRHLNAKRLIVNVDLRAWSGAKFKAEKGGEEIVRRLKIVGEKREVNFALCSYDDDCGLDLLSIEDQGNGNFV